MDKQIIVALEGQIKRLQSAFASLSEGSDLKELLIHIHVPGWTTPAESIFTRGIVDSMIVQVEVLASLKKMLLTGSSAVGKM
jgi:hypothetical protein